MVTWGLTRLGFAFGGIVVAAFIGYLLEENR